MSESRTPPESPARSNPLRTLHNSLAEARRAWPGLGFYERFEQVICFVLTLIIAGVVVAAVAALLIRVVGLLVLGVIDPAETAVFQTIFGMILTVRIALLAIARKFVILDLAETEAFKLLGLAAAARALGSVYWLVREQDRRDQASGSGGRG